jgi:hypothetical protein
MNYGYFSDSNGDLLVVDTSTQQLVWRGYLEGRKVEKTAQLPEEGECIVLMERRLSGRSDPNLWRYAHDKGVVWRAELPESGPDSYVNFELEGHELHAGSWSGYRVKVDLADGRIISRTFTK